MPRIKDGKNSGGTAAGSAATTEKTNKTADLADCSPLRATSAVSDGFCALSGDGAKASDHGGRNMWVGCDMSEQVGQPRRWLANSGRVGGEMVHAGGENHQGGPTRKGGRGGEDGIETCPGSGLPDRLGPAVVVTGQVGGGHVEFVTDMLIGEVQHRQTVAGYFSDAAPHFEGVDAVVEEVAEQFRPSRLFLVGRVPGARTAVAVVAAVRDCWVWERQQPVASGSLVPEGSSDRSPRQPRKYLVEGGGQR